MNEFLQLFLLSLLGSVVALGGGALFLYSARLSKILEKNAIPYAAGILITLALGGLIPEAIEFLGRDALLIVLAAFFGSYFFEQLFFDFHHHHDHHHHGEKNIKSSVPMVLLGDTIHNFIDGVTIGVSFIVSPAFGLVTAVSTLLHEIPHEIGDFGILLKAGWQKKHVLLVNLLSALATVVGAFLTVYFVQDDAIIGVALAISAGIFLYLGAIDFLPNATSGFKNRFIGSLPLLLGVLSMLMLLLYAPHSHVESHHDGEHEELEELHED